MCVDCSSGTCFGVCSSVAPDVVITSEVPVVPGGGFDLGAYYRGLSWLAPVRPWMLLVGGAVLLLFFLRRS